MAPEEPKPLEVVDVPAPPPRPRGKKRGRIRGFLARGLSVLLPTLLTVIILVWAYNILYDYVAEPLNHLIQHSIASASDDWTIGQVRAFWARHSLGWVGLVVALLLVFSVGLLMGSFLGRTMWRVIEGGLKRIPFLKQVYPYVKQVTDFVLRDGTLEYTRVVMVEYPRKGCWSLGLVTGLGLSELRNRTGEDLVAVFIPSSPTPVTGYVIQVPKQEIVELDMTVEQSLRFTISGGVIKPPDQPPDRRLQSAQPPSLPAG